MQVNVHLKARWLDDHKNAGLLAGGERDEERPQVVLSASADDPLAERGRRLGTIALVEAVEKHPDADALGVATVRGWKVVMNLQRDPFRAGDKAVYVEIDSIIPERLLEGRAERDILARRKFVIKTAKIRGQLSQGILFPMDILPDRESAYAVGDDVTQLLGLMKRPPMEEMVPGRAGIIKPFPTNLLPKTEEERIQNLKDLLPELRKLRYYITEKVDGSSLTCFFECSHFRVASRNCVVSADTRHGVAASNIGVEEKMRQAGLEHLALQGEVIGPKIQNNRYKSSALTVRFFSVFDTRAQKYVSFPEARRVVEQQLGLLWVPVLSEDHTIPEDATVEHLLEMADGKSSMNPAAWREGLVFRSVEEKRIPKVGRASFKAISNKWLLKFES